MTQMFPAFDNEKLQRRIEEIQKGIGLYTPTNFDNECLLLNQWLAYKINIHEIELRSAERVKEMFDIYKSTGMLFYSSNEQQPDEPQGTIDLYAPLNFEE